MAVSRSALGAVALLAAVAAVVGADRAFPAEVPAVAGAAGPSEERPLSAATLVCPDAAEAGGGDRSTQITYAGDQAGGAVTAHWLTAATPETPATGSDQAQALPEQTHNFVGVVLTASGAAATGFTASMTSRYDAGATAGTAGLACLAPTSEAYFVGPGTTLGRDPRLVLVNPDPTPANVDVSIAQDAKPFSPDNTRGIHLDGYGTTTIPLVDVAAEQAALAIHVLTRSGRVTAAVRDRWFSGSLPLGIDWLAAGAGPATDVVVPGVGGAGAAVTLVLASQSTDAGTVSVQALNATGAFTPAGLDSIELAPGAIVRLTVPRSAFAVAGALHVTSDVPLLASAVSVRGDAAKPPRPDLAWSPSAAPLSGPVRTPAGAQVVLTSATSTSVSLRSDSVSSALTVQLDVPAGAAVTVGADVFPAGALVVPATPGLVRAAAVTTPPDLGGAITASMLTAPPRTVVLLPARPDILLGSR